MGRGGERSEQHKQKYRPPPVRIVFGGGLCGRRPTRGRSLRTRAHRPECARLVRPGLIIFIEPRPRARCVPHHRLRAHAPPVRGITAPAVAGEAPPKLPRATSLHNFTTNGSPLRLYFSSWISRTFPHVPERGSPTGGSFGERLGGRTIQPSAFDPALSRPWRPCWICKRRHSCIRSHKAPALTITQGTCEKLTGMITA